GQDGGKLDEGHEAEAGDLTGHLGDADRTAELVGGLAAGDDAADVTKRALDHRPRLLYRHHHRLRWRHRMHLEVLGRHGAADAEDADPLHVAEIVLALLERRLRLENKPLAAAIDRDGERFARVRPDNPLHFAEILNRTAIDGDDHVAGLEAG